MAPMRALSQALLGSFSLYLIVSLHQAAFPEEAAALYSSMDSRTQQQIEARAAAIGETTDSDAAAEQAAYAKLLALAMAEGSDDEDQVLHEPTPPPSAPTTPRPAAAAPKERKLTAHFQLNPKAATPKAAIPKAADEARFHRGAKAKAAAKSGSRAPRKVKSDAATSEGEQAASLLEAKAKPLLAAVKKHSGAKGAAKRAEALHALKDLLERCASNSRDLVGGRNWSSSGAHEPKRPRYALGVT